MVVCECLFWAEPLSTNDSCGVTHVFQQAYIITSENFLRAYQTKLNCAVLQLKLLHSNTILLDDSDQVSPWVPHLG